MKFEIVSDLDNAAFEDNGPVTSFVGSCTAPSGQLRDRFRSTHE
jgi:hypothetical protein